MFEAESKAKTAKKDIAENRNMLKREQYSNSMEEEKAKESIEISDDSTITDDSFNRSRYLLYVLDVKAVPPRP